MQLLINISDYDLEYIKNMYDIPKDISVSIAEALLNGRKIPPHGRLGDLDKLKRKAQKVATEAWKMKLTAKIETTINQFIDWLDNAETIVEAE